MNKPRKTSKTPSPLSISARNLTPGAVHESEERFRQLIECAPDAVFVQSQGRFVYLNPSMLRLIGATKQEQLLGRDFMASVAPEYHEPIRWRIRLQSKTGNPAPPMDQEYLRLDGSRVPVEVTAVPVQYNGEDAHMVFLRDLSGRKRAEESVRNMLNMQQVLIEAIPAPVFFKNAERIYIGGNKAFEQFIGLTRAQFVGKSVYEIAPKDLAERYDRADKELLAAGGTQTYDGKVLYADGTLRDVIFNKATFNDATGKLAGLIGVILDISDRKKAESEKQHALGELLRVRTEFEHFFDVVPNLFCVASTDGYFKMLNPEWERTLGYTLKELLEIPYKYLIHPDDAEPTRAEIVRQMKGSRTISFTNRYRHKNGTYRWLEWYATPAIGDKLFAAARDVTERRQMEDALKISEEKFSKAFKTSPYAITITRPEDGRFVEVNDAFTLISGYTREEALSDSSIGLSLWVNQSDRTDVVTALRSGETVAGREYKFRTKDGRIIAGLFSAQFLQLAGGTCVLSSINDITHRKQAEEALATSEAKYRTLFSALGYGFALNEIVLDGNGAPADYITVEVNKAYESILGVSKNAVVGRNAGNFLSQAELKKWVEIFGKVVLNNQPIHYELYSSRNDKHFHGYAYPAGNNKFAVIFEDISNQKAEERRQLLTTEILAILNDSIALTDSIDRILVAIKRETGFDAVGIRLKRGDDFPYFTQNGFSNDFLLAENSLIDRDSKGEMCRDRYGNICLQCTCGLVVTGHTDAGNPLFTPGGSAWTNNSLPLLDIPPDQDPRLHPRNKCIHEGFLSVALIPIKSNREIVGLLQLNDRRKDRFTLESVQFFERLSNSIGVALHQKLTVAALMRSEEQHRTILQTAMDGFFIADTSGRLLEVNDAYCRMSGYGREELLAMSIYDLKVADSREEIARLTQKVIEKGSDRYESRHRRKDGSIFDIELSVQYRPVDGGRLIVFLHEITNRKRMMNEIIFKNAILTAQGELSLDGILVVDREGTILSFNRRFIEMWGIPAEVAASRSDQRALDCVLDKLADPDGFLLKVRELYTHPDDKSRDEIILRDGRVFDRFSSPVVIDGGSVIGRIWYFRDISDIKQAELVKAKMTRLDRLASLGTLIAGVAHEINNPNQFITMNTAIIRDAISGMLPILDEYRKTHGNFKLGGLEYDEMKSELPGLLDAVSEGSARIGRIVSDCKQFATADTVSISGSVNLNEVVKSATRLLSNKIRKHTESFTETYDPEMPAIRGNQLRLAQVAVNLIHNACEALTARNQKLAVSTGYDRLAGTVFLKVTDQGMGMTEDILKHLLEPFFTTKRDRGGIGLGLSVSYGIAVEHGGNLTFNSKPGEGTTALLTLPIEKLWPQLQPSDSIRPR